VGSWRPFSATIAAAETAQWTVESELTDVQGSSPVGSARSDASISVRDFDVLAKDLHDLSRVLTPPPLQRFGLRAALQDLCNRFSRQFTTAFTVTCAPDTDAMNDAVAMCLFRVAQEALHNVTKHSRATQAFVLVKVPL
jgi:signal transduction histidine kinase